MLVEIDRLSIAFGSAEPVATDISWGIEHGRSLAVVGESGSGKSVTALALTRLLPEPWTRYPSGSIRVDGRDVLRLSPEELRRLRGGTVAYVFQEPATALNPVFTVRTQIGEALRLHRPDLPPEARDEEILRWLQRVRLTEPEKRLGAYPHELSGGMQQRVMIAMALCSRPKLLVADEPTTALDVTVEADIMALLRELKQELGMSVLLITHKLSIIRGLADEVVVMFRGRIVERGPAAEVLDRPSHPYTRALIDCIPRLGAHRRRLATIGETLTAGPGS